MLRDTVGCSIFKVGSRMARCAKVPALNAVSKWIGDRYLKR